MRSLRQEIRFRRNFAEGLKRQAEKTTGKRRRELEYQIEKIKESIRSLRNFFK